MNVLAIETATEACSAALSTGGRITERYQVAPRRHAELILPMVDELLREAGLKLADLDGLAFGRGPGAFTGVRIATGVMQGLAFGADRPVVGVSTLAALAQGAAADCDHILSAVDARMGEVYWGAFQVNGQGLVRACGNELVCAPSEVETPAESVSWHGVGTGWGAYEAALREAMDNRVGEIDATRLPRARDVLVLALPEFHAGRGVPAEQALPVYLRDKVTG